MKISGKGGIDAGEYNDILSVKGSAKINGDVQCKGLEASGSVKSLGNITAAENVKVSGKISSEGSVDAGGDINFSGSAKFDGAIISKKDISALGKLVCGKNVKCNSLKVKGSFEGSEDIEAEDVSVSGSIKCNGFINAESAKIAFSGKKNEISGIGGTRIYISFKGLASKVLPTALSAAIATRLRVKESIEGDIVSVSHVIAPEITGRVVNIGKCCEIEKVFYTESITIDPDATVKNFEKIS